MIRIRLDLAGDKPDRLTWAAVFKQTEAGGGFELLNDEISHRSGDSWVSLPAVPGVYRIDYELGGAGQDWRSGESIRRPGGLHPAPFPSKEGTLWGYIDDAGRTAIEPRFEYADEFQPEGLAVVQRRGHSGLINISGREVVPPVYEFIGPFREGRAVASDTNGYFLMDTSGREVTGKRYNYINPLSEGRAVFYTDKEGEPPVYGYLDAGGREVIPARYADASDFEEGRALVKIRDGEYALIGPSGQTLQVYRHPFVGNPGDGLLAFQETENGKYGYLAIGGQVAIPPRFTAALPFQEGRAIVNTAEDFGNAYGLIDKTGRYAIEPRYAQIEMLGEGRVALGTPIVPAEPYRGYRYVIALADNGRILSGHPLLGVSPYKDGLASVYDADETYFIDLGGGRASQPPVVTGSGSLSFSGNLIRADVDMRTSYYDRKGRSVWREATRIPLRSPYVVLERKYKPNRNYLVYYPEVEGMADKAAQASVNERLRKLSLAEGAGQSGDADYTYSGDFSVSFFRKQLLQLRLDGYRYPFGAAHGMPTRLYPHINLRTGRFYDLKDLFKPGGGYVARINEIIAGKVANDPQYDYVFPGAFQGIAPDQPFFVDEEALYIYFAPYEIAPYAAGFPEFRIPYAELMGLISTEGEFWRSFH